VALLPPADPIQLQARLYEEQQVQLAIGTWHDQLQLHVSVQGYNNRRDLDGALAAITDLLPRRWWTFKGLGLGLTSPLNPLSPRGEGT
jgi:hypothetical protein